MRIPAWRERFSVTDLPVFAPAARSVAAAALVDDASSQHSSDQSDTRTEHSDDDLGDKAPKRSTGTKTAKKPAAVKTEVNICTKMSRLICVQNVLLF